VMGDQPAQQCVGVLGVAQIAGAVEGVQACYGQAGRVAKLWSQALRPYGFRIRAVSRRPRGWVRQRAYGVGLSRPGVP
jgi:hypothetical protein